MNERKRGGYGRPSFGFDPAYTKYLKSEQWRMKREAWFAKYGRYCRACYTRQGPIQLNHLTYERLGNERLSDLIALCVPCHRSVTKHHRRNRRKGHRENTLFVIAAIRSGQLRPGE